MGIRLSQFYLYNNHDYRGIVEMAALFYAEGVLGEERFAGDEARRAMADDVVNGRHGRSGEAVARLARSAMRNGDLLGQAITGDVVHPKGIDDGLLDYLVETHWGAVAAAVYGDLVEPPEEEGSET